MRCDVVIKSWYGDLCWLSYCLTFLEKNWQEPDSKIVVLADSNCRDVIRAWGFSSRVRYFYVDPWPDGNQFQGYLTLTCDQFSDAELLAIFDSDTMLLERMDVGDLTNSDGNPFVWFLPYDYEDQSPWRSVPRLKWGPIMERWLGVRPQADYMQRFPFVYRRETLAAVRELIIKKTGRTVLESLYSDVPYAGPASFSTHPFKFVDHDVIGFYCALHESGRYALRDVRYHSGHPRVVQYHSWTQWSPETRAQLDRLLAEGYSERIASKKTRSGWTVLDSDVLDGHSSLTLQFDRMDVDVGALPTHEFIKPYLRPGTIAIDVGAHIGNFTVPMMRMLGKGGLVVAYEPHPSIFQCLCQNIEKELAENPEAARCSAFQCALGTREIEGQLFCNPTNFASNTLLEGVLSGPPALKVKVMRLDSVLAKLDPDQRISFIKIDVEGAEWNVLRGGIEVLSRHKPALFFETSENFVAIRDEANFLEFLHDFGYQKFIGFPQEWIDAGHHAHDVLALP